MAVASAIVLSGVVALPVIAFSSSGKTHDALVSTSQGPATTAPALQEGSDAMTGTTVAPATTVPAPATTTTVAAAPRQSPTTTALVCRNSYDSACGPFRWDPTPAPAGAPSVTIDVSPANPTTGETVTFTVTVSDPNTAVYTCGQIDFGPMGQGCAAQSAQSACPTRYGPWDPPARYADSATTSYTYQYSNAGTYTVTAKYPVGGFCYDPYQGQASGSVAVTVTAAPPTTATTTP